MHSATYVDNLITTLKAQGVPLSDVAWQAALACVSWPYVFGARGQYCTPSGRRSFDYNAHPYIKTKCQNFDGSGTCSGCKWYPDNKRVRFFDCRGFTYWILLQVYGWKLMGSGCTAQWNNKANWKAKGKISDGIPANTLCCVFYSKDNKEKTWEHTGLYYNGETVECGAGVTHSKTLNKKWTHWGIPACVDGAVPTPVPPTPTPPTPTPTPDHPTLRRGSKGEWVTVLQTKLSMLGYDLGSCGIDGDYGKATVNAVKAFQRDVGLTADGICGPKTWAALDETPKQPLYTVIIPHVTLSKAQELASQYVGATYTAEG
jgi:hypothetical protein